MAQPHNRGSVVISSGEGVGAVALAPNLFIASSTNGAQHVVSCLEDDAGRLGGTISMNISLSREQADKRAFSTRRGRFVVATNFARGTQ